MIDRSRLGRRSRNKGKAWEQRVARDLRPTFGPGVKRGLAQSRFGRGEAPDVDGCPPLWIETKIGKQPSPRAALQQAVDAMAAAARPQDRWPCAVVKDDPRPAFVVMRYDDWKELVGEWHDASTRRSDSRGTPPAAAACPATGRTGLAGSDGGSGSKPPKGAGGVP